MKRRRRALVAMAASSMSGVAVAAADLGADEATSMQEAAAAPARSHTRLLTVEDLSRPAD